ncbi:MAG: NUDIX domain-containing protein [Acidimicrobiia bacterium]
MDSGTKYRHAPDDYVCPFCLIGRREFTNDGLTQEEHIVFRTSAITAFVSPHWWPNNPGHCLVIPNQHYENIYEMPSGVSEHIHAAAREIALAMKAGYGCDGTSTRQHNEPAGYQDVWHYHLHVFPRWKDDHLYLLSNEKNVAPPQERLERAATLRKSLGPYPPIPWPPRKPVCVGAVVVRDGKALFVRQAKGHPLEGIWTIPWGFAEQGDKPEEACLKEVHEEAGVTAKLEGLIGMQNLRKPDDAFGLVFLCSHESGEPKPDGTETDDAAYFSLEDLEALGDKLNPTTGWMARRVLEGTQNLMPLLPEGPRGLPGFW